MSMQWSCQEDTPTRTTDLCSVGEIGKEFYVFSVSNFVAGIVPKWNSESIFSKELFFLHCDSFHSVNTVFNHLLHKFYVTPSWYQTLCYDK